MTLQLVASQIQHRTSRFQSKVFFYELLVGCIAVNFVYFPGKLHLLLAGMSFLLCSPMVSKLFELGQRCKRLESRQETPIWTRGIRTLPLLGFLSAVSNRETQ